MHLRSINDSPLLSPPVEGDPGGRRNILIVDQDVEAMQGLTSDLAVAGFQVDLAASAGQALDCLRESGVEMILLGESLPGMAGLDLLRLLRAAWTPQQLPVIFLAGESGSGVEAEALAAGANDCVLCPLDGTRVLARIRSQLRQKDAGQGVSDRADRVLRATNGSSDVVWEWNCATGAIWFSGEWSRLTGVSSAGPHRMEDWLLAMHPDDAKAVEAAIGELRGDPEQFEFGQEYRLITASGDERWIYCRASVERDRGGALLRLTGLQTDITRNKSIDWLTQLPNRENILGRVDRMLAGTGGGALPFALLLVDLDRFRLINESHGPTAGDRILREAAMRLERATRTIATGDRPLDYLARLHGDTFLLILNGVGSAPLARSIADRLQAEIRRPMQLEGRELRLSASIGIASSTAERYHRAFDILRDADIALHQAKALGRARSISFDPEMRTEAMQRMDLEIDLRSVLDTKELVLYYQPKIDLQTGALAGFEALLRWRHPRLGFILPAKFIPIAEETGLIVPIGMWAMEEAARQLANWRSLAPGATLQVSVNLSVKQFFDRDLAESVAAIVENNALPAGSFCLEVTESVLIGEIAAAERVLRRLHTAGVGLMIDDFGAGYSSLNYLTNLTFDTLKIDRSFITRLVVDENCAEVVRAVISLAKKLKLDVVAEGVETQQQVEALRALECRYGQGYLFAEPLDAAAATAMVLAAEAAGQRPA